MEISLLSFLQLAARFLAEAGCHSGFMKTFAPNGFAVPDDPIEHH